MDGPGECHTQGSKSEREITYDIPDMWTLKRNDTNELIYKTETHRLRRPTYGCQEGKGLVRELGKVMYTLLTAHTSCPWVSPSSRGQDNEINLPLL